MSGQRNKKPDDIIKKRQEYLDNLNLEISLQDANEQAIKTYKETGQMPVSTQMKDNRSVEDKLRDFEKLKASIREDLLPIANISMVNNIIQIIQNSPFNKDNGLLVFLAQRAPDIVKNLSKIYKFGIKGDLNDAEQFTQFVIKMYSDKNSMVENTKSIMARLGTNTQTGLAKKATEQSYILSSLEAEMNTIINDVSRTINNQVFRRVLEDKQRNISANINIVRKLYPPSLSYNIPNTNLTITLMDLENYFNNEIDTNTLAINEKNDFQLFLQYLNHNIPNTDYYNTLITQLKRAGEYVKTSDNVINRQKFIDSIDNIYEYIFNTGETLNELVRIQDALNRILNNPNLRQYAQQAGQPQVPPQPQPQVPPQPQAPPQPQPQAPPVHPIPARFPQAFDPNNNPWTPQITAEIQADIANLTGLVNPLPAGNVKNELQARLRRARLSINRIPPMTVVRLLHTIFIDVSNIYGQQPNWANLRTGYGFNMRGSGFPQPAYNFTKQYVEPTEGVQSDPRYIKFGRYLVNTKSLKDNKLSLRREKGTPIASLPVYKMSNPFSKVIKKIVGGSLPSQDDFSDLTEEELRYLHKVSKESDLSHKIEIPTPSKDEDEKDAHLFNVYKGEIMAGNDNKEMIRKFKLLLIKLSKNNTIDKREANEILEMLTHAGY